MAKFDANRIITDETGYNYVRVTPEEVRNWGGYNICNGCNKMFLNEDTNLLWACSDIYCDECFNKMKNNWKTMSKEDIEYDVKLQNESSLDWYRYHLDDDFRTKIQEYNEESSHYAEHTIQLMNDEDFEQILREMIGESNEN